MQWVVWVLIFIVDDFGLYLCVNVVVECVYCDGVLNVVSLMVGVSVVQDVIECVWWLLLFVVGLYLVFVDGLVMLFVYEIFVFVGCDG